MARRIELWAGHCTNYPSFPIWRYICLNRVLEATLATSKIAVLEVIGTDLPNTLWPGRSGNVQLDIAHRQSWAPEKGFRCATVAG